MAAPPRRRRCSHEMSNSRPAAQMKARVNTGARPIPSLRMIAACLSGSPRVAMAITPTLSQETARLISTICRNTDKIYLQPRGF